MPLGKKVFLLTKGRLCRNGLLAHFLFSSTECYNDTFLQEMSILLFIIHSFTQTTDGISNGDKNTSSCSPTSTASIHTSFQSLQL